MGGRTRTDGHPRQDNNYVAVSGGTPSGSPGSIVLDSTLLEEISVLADYF